MHATGQPARWLLGLRSLPMPKPFVLLVLLLATAGRSSGEESPRGGVQGGFA
jgi:hypothetical protein